MKPATVTPTPSTVKQQKRLTNRSRHEFMIAAQNRKFRPASRAERVASWHQRMQSLFTRQAY